MYALAVEARRRIRSIFEGNFCGVEAYSRRLSIRLLSTNFCSSTLL